MIDILALSAASINGNSHSVLNAFQRVEVPNPGHNGCIQALCNSIQSNQRLIANGLSEIFVDLSSKSTSSFHELQETNLWRGFLCCYLPGFFNRFLAFFVTFYSLFREDKGL